MGKPLVRGNFSVRDALFLLPASPVTCPGDGSDNLCCLPRFFFLIMHFLLRQDQKRKAYFRLLPFPLSLALPSPSYVHHWRDRNQKNTEQNRIG